MTLPSIFNTLLLAVLDQTSSPLFYTYYEDNLLLETGDSLLLETGSNLILEQADPLGSGILQSNGDALILS